MHGPLNVNGVAVDRGWCYSKPSEGEKGQKLRSKTIKIQSKFSTVQVTQPYDEGEGRAPAILNQDPLLNML